MNNIYVLVSETPNGVGHAIVACDGSGNPKKWLAEYFLRQGYKYPGKATEPYKVVQMVPHCTTHEGIVDVLEYFDGIMNRGNVVKTFMF